MAITINGSSAAGNIDLGTNGTITDLAAGGLPDNTVDGGNLAMGSDAAGDILYYNGTDYIRLAKGTDGQVLTLASGVPTWAAASGGDNTPAFNAYMNADVSIGHDSLHKVVFQAEDFDTDNAYDTSNGKFTVPSGKGGKYMLSAQIVVDDVDSGGERMEFYPYINGSAKDDMHQSWSNYPANSGQMSGSSLNGVYTLAAGDEMELYAYQTAGQTEHLQHNMCWWSMFRLAGV